MNAIISDNKCQAHPKLENDSYCSQCKTLLCIMCNLAHKKSHSDHQIEALTNIIVNISSEIEKLDPTIIAADLVQAETSGVEEKLKIKLFELTKVTETIKTMIMKCVDDWAKPQLDKIVKELEECEEIKNQMKIATEFSQKREKMLESIPELYADRKFAEIIQMKEQVQDIKTNLEKSKGAKEKVIILQEKAKKLRIAFVKEAMEDLNSRVSKLLNPFVLFSYADICAKCCVEMKDANEIHKCSVCMSNEVVFCKNCIIKCDICDKDCCKKCIKLCEKCNSNSICLKCKDEICKNCNYFGGSIMNMSDWKKLSELYGSKIEVISLLFKASRDGFNAKAFHDKCDNKGPTITVVKSSYDKIFGGYADVSWDTRNNWVNSPRNFVFSISQNKIFRERNNHGSSQYNGSNYGPMFESDYLRIGYSQYNWDTNINSNCDSSTSNDYCEAASSRISGSNDNVHFTVKEVEIFQVKI